MSSMTESDWKKFKEASKVALERHCERVLLEVQSLLSDTRKSAHERYLAIYALVDDRDKVLAHLFNDARRSTALQQLIGMVNENLLTDSELASFSDEIKQRLS